MNEVILIVLYPKSTPYLQMCDTTIFAPLKAKHSELYQQRRTNYPGRTMNDVEFVKTLKQVNDAVIREEIIINRWRRRATGLQPFNFNNLNANDLVSKSLDRLYDFKGDHIDPLSVDNQQVDVLSYVEPDPTSKLCIQQAIPNAATCNDFLTFNINETEECRMSSGIGKKNDYDENIYLFNCRTFLLSIRFVKKPMSSTRPEYCDFHLILKV